MFGARREGRVSGGLWSFVVLLLGRLARETGARKDASPSRRVKHAAPDASPSRRLEDGG